MDLPLLGRFGSLLKNPNLGENNTQRNLLHSYLGRLHSHPLRTKQETAGILSALGEIIATYIAFGSKAKLNTLKVYQMGFYGYMIVAPLSDFLVSSLQKLCSRYKSITGKLLYILLSNLIISPILNSIFLLYSYAISKKIDQINMKDAIKFLKSGFMSTMKASWISSPISILFAQAFIPPEAWVPFFSFYAFLLGTYNNIQAKKRSLKKY